MEYCKRPANYEKLMFNSMMTLGEDDVLIHLGDICMGQDEAMHEKYIMPLKCHKWLVKGNHDHKSNTFFLKHGWGFVAEMFKEEMYGKKILFSHTPQVWDVWYDINIHGHFHNTDHRKNDPSFNCKLNNMQILYAPEYENYQVVSLEKLIKRKNETHRTQF